RKPQSLLDVAECVRPKAVVAVRGRNFAGIPCSGALIVPPVYPAHAEGNAMPNPHCCARCKLRSDRETGALAAIDGSAPKNCVFRGGGGRDFVWHVYHLRAHQFRHTESRQKV